jgi:GNAT superfamily N-acetyltransferase
VQCGPSTKMRNEIRRAAPEDAATLTEISHAAKRHWGYPEHWIQHWSADLTITPEFITKNEVYLAANREEILGFYALVIADGQAELEHMWVRPEHIGAGIGKELFVHAMQRAASLSVAAVGITADPNAAGFYQHLGAIRIGAAESEIDGKPRLLPRLKIDPNLS